MYLKFLKLLGLRTQGNITLKRIDKLRKQIYKEITEIEKESGAIVVIKNFEVSYFIDKARAQRLGF